MPINRSYADIVLALVVICPQVDAAAGEYSDADSLPKIESITFLEESIVIQTVKVPATFLPYQDPSPDFLFDRQSRVATPINRAKAEELSDGQTTKRIVQAGRTYDSPSVTSDGIPYEIPESRCAYGVDGEPVRRVQFDSREIEISMNSCSSAYEMESTGDYLWVGTYRFGGHGDYGAEGLLILNRDTLTTATKINTGVLAIRNVVRDPFSGYIWVITDDQITIVSGNVQHQHRFQFYHDFNPSSGHPTVYLQEGVHHNNALAILASGLPKENRSDFYEQTKSIPEKLRAEFSLYKYFMCCDLQFLNDPLPEQFNILVPFLRIGAKNTWEANRGKPRNWRQIACQLDHPEAEKLCATDDWFDDK